MSTWRKVFSWRATRFRSYWRRLVNDVYEVFAEHNNMKNMSLSDLKTVANKKMNPLQRIIKALSDVFVDIMPGILAAALLTGLSGVLGNMEFVQANDTLYGINRLINISSGAIFGFLPLAVAYSACKTGLAVALS